MLFFRNDYSAGAHPAVLEALCRTNADLTPGYGLDPYCEAAAAAIRRLCRAPEAAVHFLVGGTQVNKTAIGAFLRPYEAAMAASTGHICVHETGAVEQDGHKILHLPAPDGKLTPDTIRAAAEGHSSEHMVVPRLVYLSNTTEVGTVYSLAELKALRAVCGELGLLLYCDGARLGSAIAAGDTDFPDYAGCCDAFTIGGTKNGLLFGEALVIVNPALKPYFRNCMKQQGAVLAKGRLLGVQFEAVLKDNLYLSIAARENELAQSLAAGLRELGVEFLVESPSNQIFPIFSDGVVAGLEKEAAFEIQEKLPEGRTCVRFVTGWQSTEEDVAGLLAAVKPLLNNNRG